ncbi:MAG: hypothetical protein MZU79_04430 [Anaerotruncus sp.]|nr:hypothetical protein [Anaerotruncus sp.]
MDAERGTPLAVLEAGYLTAVRTGRRLRGGHRRPGPPGRPGGRDLRRRRPGADPARGHRRGAPDPQGPRLRRRPPARPPRSPAEMGAKLGIEVEPAGPARGPGRGRRRLARRRPPRRPSSPDARPQARRPHQRRRLLQAPCPRDPGRDRPAGESLRRRAPLLPRGGRRPDHPAPRGAHRRGPHPGRDRPGPGRAGGRAGARTTRSPCSSPWATPSRTWPWPAWSPAEGAPMEFVSILNDVLGPVMRGPVELSTRPGPTTSAGSSARCSATSRRPRYSPSIRTAPTPRPTGSRASTWRSPRDCSAGRSPTPGSPGPWPSRRAQGLDIRFRVARLAGAGPSEHRAGEARSRSGGIGSAFTAKSVGGGMIVADGDRRPAGPPRRQERRAP